MKTVMTDVHGVAKGAVTFEKSQRMTAMTMRKIQNGITLVELLVVVVIISILASFAYPSYLESTRKSRRADATIALTDLASRMERHYSEHNTFATATIASNPATDLLTSTSSPDGHYTLSIEAKSATTYTIKAEIAADGGQVGDTKCGDFSLTNTGLKTVSGSESASYCW